MPDPMTASDLAVQLVAKLATTVERLDEHIERRAEGIADERSARCTQIAHRAAEEADRQNQRIAALEAELTAVRTSQWTPRAYPSAPLTPEQDADAAAGNARTDWPAFVRSCDPVVTVGGISCDRTGWVIYALDLDQGSEHAWSALVAAVAAHRCGEVPA